MDIINNLSELAFASRLKRLSDRLLKDVSRIYRELDIDFEARWFSVLYTLKDNKKMTVTGLAQALSLTHPAINQIASEMTSRGLLLSGKDALDERKRVIRLSKKGQRVAEELAPVWEKISLVTRELMAESRHEPLEVLSDIEDALDRRELYVRLRDKILGISEEIEIVDYRPAYKKYFQSLNREWLERYFSVEPEDDAILSDPNGKIIRTGGAVLFASADSAIVGACALTRHSRELFELCKMAVTEKAQGKGIGRKLAQAVIERARMLGGSRIILETSPKLEAACKLYKSLGFKNSDLHIPDRKEYERCTIAMELELI